MQLGEAISTNESLPTNPMKPRVRGTTPCQTSDKRQGA